MPKVLVTGGTGFIAGHCIEQLLAKNYEVVTTVRSNEKGDRLVKAYTTSSSEKKLSYVIVKDIAQKGAFDDAIQSLPDLDYVIHTASPFHYDVSDPVKNFLEPAVVGTTSIFEALHGYSNSVKRVVLLSSFAAMRTYATPQPKYDESSWNPVTWDEAATDTKKTYAGSKKLAERAAWDFMDSKKPSFDLVVINPSLVFGPVTPHLTKGDLPNALNTSNLRIYNMLCGKMEEKLEPTGFYSWVDVRDVAAAHVLALEVSDAAKDSGRCLMIAGYFTNKEIAENIQKMGVADGKLPDLSKAEYDLPEGDDRYTWDDSRMKKLFGIQYHSLEDSVRDTVRSMQAIM